MDDKGLVKRVINSSKNKSSMLFGQMVLFEPGRDQTVIIMDDSVNNEYLVEKIALTAGDDGKKRELIESVLYFGVKDNHVVIVQSHALRARQCELHFDWLLTQCTEVLPDNKAFYLSDTPTESARKRFKSYR